MALFVSGKLFKKAGEGSGGGGGDKHNLGWFSTLSELQTAYPTAEAGDWAIVGTTDTVWIWDTDNSEWVDSDQKGQVTSVNNKTGAVTLTASDVGAATSAQGAKADTAVQPSDLATVATTGLYSDLSGTPTIPDAVQFSTMPTASVDYLGRIIEFTGTTDSTYTNGYFYKCVSDGQTPATYSWTQTDVQPQAGGLPSQTGQSGKFLTTDGTDASWSDKPLVNIATDADSFGVGGRNTGGRYNTSLNGTIFSQYCEGNVVIAGSAGSGASNTSNSVIIGGNSGNGDQSVIVIGSGAKTGAGGGKLGIAIGRRAGAMATGAIQLGGSSESVATENYSANTFKVANANGNFEMMSADGTIPTDRFTTTPVADGSYVPTVTISSGVATRTWGAAGGGATSATGTLVAASWSSSTQTINVTGVTASNNVIVAPAPASQADYTSAGIMCTAQGAGTLTFTCTSTPASDLTVNVLIM